MRFVLFFWFLTGPCLLLAKSHTLHALVACDTTTEPIQSITRIDRERVKKFVLSVAKEVNLHANITVLDGEMLSMENVNRWLSTTHVDPADTLFCYVTGLGKRGAPQPTPWPLFSFPLDGSLFIEKVRALRPRLAIILFESCNSVVLTTSVKKNFYKCAPHLEQGLHVLFRKSRGIIAACAAEAGQTAIGICVNDNPYVTAGGVFTTSFLASVCEQADSKESSWEKVLKKTKLYCEKLSKDVSSTTQTPYFQTW